MWLYGDSFDGYTDLSTRYNSVGVNGQAISVGNGRFGTNCVRFTNGNGRILKGVAPGSSTSGGFASMALLHTPNLPGYNLTFANIWDGTTGFGHVCFVHNDDGSISAWRQTVNQQPLQFQFGVFIGATPAGLIHPSIYSSVEVYAKIHASAGVIRVRVNGDEVLTLTGQNTKNPSASGLWTGWYFGLEFNAGITCIDDLMLYDDFDNSDGGPTDFVGDLSGEFCPVSGAGTHADMTRNTGATNASCVDENPPDDDTTYVEDGTVGHLDTYTHSGLTRIVSGIRCVQVVTVAKKTGAGTRAITGVIRRSGTDYPGADEYLGTDYTVGLDSRPLDPVTSSTWSAANVNASEIGQKVTV